MNRWSCYYMHKAFYLDSYTTLVIWLSPNDTFVCMFRKFPTWKDSFRLWKVFCVWKCQIPLCRVASFPSVAMPVYPIMALLPNDYNHLVTCPEVVSISDNQCITNQFITELNCIFSLLDSFPLPGHTRGSSHGASRVTRYLGDDDLAKLEYRDCDSWHCIMWQNT